MGRATGAALFLCAAVAFFVPLGLKSWRGAEAARPDQVPQDSFAADQIGDAWGRAMAAPETKVRRVEREWNSAGGADRAVLDLDLVPDEPQPVVPGPATWLETDLPDDERPRVTPWEGLPVGDLQQLLFKLLLATGVVLGLCVVLLRWGNRFLVGTGARGSQRELELADSIAVSRDAGVKLIRIGNQRVVVGHDRGGLRGMVLLPTRFDEVLSDVRSDDRQELQGSVQAALRNPEDNGWDLTQPIS